MEGIPIGLLSGWAFGSTIAMTVVMMVARGTWVPGTTHQLMIEDRNFYRDKFEKLQAERDTSIETLEELLKMIREQNAKGQQGMT
jgi:alpha/beta superfamily hydrolase